MAVTHECCFCYASVNDWRHSLIDCAMAQSVWTLLDEELVEHISINQYSDAKEWIFFPSPGPNPPWLGELRPGDL
jgi:hypothetical protein